MSLPQLDLPFDIPDIKKEYVPYAYGLLALGALIIIKNPRNLLTAISAYMTWQSIVEKGKQTAVPGPAK